MSTHGNNSNEAPIQWDAVFAVHGSWLRGVIFARVGDAHAVDEVFQEVAAAAVEQRSAIADQEKIGSWLYRVAVAHSLRYQKKVRRRRHETVAAMQNNRVDSGDPYDIPLNWLLSDCNLTVPPTLRASKRTTFC